MIVDAQVANGFSFAIGSSDVLARKIMKDLEPDLGERWWEK